MKKLYKIVLSVLLMAESDFILSMDKQTSFESLCDFIYNYRVPCNTPVSGQQSVLNRESLVDYSLDEMNAYVGDPRMYRERIQNIMAGQQEFVASSKITHSPRSVVTIHPDIVVQKKGFGNKPLEAGLPLKGILKRSKSV